jgi:hypothetical protein
VGVVRLGGGRRVGAGADWLGLDRVILRIMWLVQLGTGYLFRRFGGMRESVVEILV